MNCINSKNKYSRRYVGHLQAPDLRRPTDAAAVTAANYVACPHPLVVLYGRPPPACLALPTPPLLSSCPPPARLAPPPSPPLLPLCRPPPAHCVVTSSPPHRCGFLLPPPTLYERSTALACCQRKDITATIVATAPAMATRRWQQQQWQS
jgi:hypothetical protein